MGDGRARFLVSRDITYDHQGAATGGLAELPGMAQRERSAPMSNDITPETKPPANRNKLLIIIGTTVVVLLVVIAVSVSSQAIRAGQESDAKASAEASASAMSAALDAAQKVIDDQHAADAKEANTVCGKRLIQKHPTATVLEGKTKSTFKASDGSYDTTGAYTDAPAGNTIPMQFVCSSIKGSGTSWTVFLKSDGHGTN